MLNSKNSARYNGNEDDSAKNYQININTEKWINDDLKFHSTDMQEELKQIMMQAQVMRVAIHTIKCIFFKQV